MRLTSEITAPLLSQLNSFIECSMSITDEHGTIVASTNDNRINMFLPGASEALMTGREKIYNIRGSVIQIIQPIELYNKILGALSIECNGDIPYAYPIAKVIKMNLQVTLDRIHMSQRLQYQKKAKEAWLFELINPAGCNTGEMEAVAESIGLNCRLQRSVMVIRIHELTHQTDVQQLAEVKEQIVNKLRERLPGSALMMFTGEKLLVLCLPFTGEERTEEKKYAEMIRLFLEKSNYPCCIGIGERSEGIENYRESYIQAKQSVQLLQRFMNGEGTAHIGDWGIIRLMDSIPYNVRLKFAEHYQSFLHNLSNEQEKTLEVFLKSDLNVKEAAEKLHLHRNTLLYRLDRLTDHIQLDPRKFNDAIIYQLLLICKRING